MTADQHRKTSIYLKAQITRLRNRAKAPGLTLAQKLEILDKAKLSEHRLAEHKLNYFTLVTE